MTTSTKWMGIKSRAFAMLVAGTSLLTVNNLAQAESEASLQAGSQAVTQSSGESSQHSTSSSTTQNSAEASNEPSTSSVTQNQSQASVEAGQQAARANYDANAKPSVAPFAVGQEAKKYANNNNANSKPVEATPKSASAAARTASVKAPKTKTVTYHWGRSAIK